MNNARCNIFKKTPKQGMSSTFFATPKVFLHFQFEFRFMRPLLGLLSKFFNAQTNLAKRIVVGAQDLSYLLECKYIFFLIVL